MDIQLQPGQQTIRIPAYAPTDERTQGIFGTADGMDQMLINMIPSRQPDGSYLADKRPGMSVALNDFTTTFSGLGGTAKDNITMTMVSDVGVMAYFDVSASKIYIMQYLPAGGGSGAPASVKIGEITGANVKDWVHLTELNIAGVPTLGVIWTKYDKSTSKGYYATTVASVFPAGSLTEITAGVDADFPANVAGKVCTGPFVQMNQNVFVMTTDGGVYNSDDDSITSWNTLGQTAAQAYPDHGIGLCRYKNFIVAFSEDSIEFFNYVGAPPPGSPLQRTDQAFIKFGCADPKLFRNVDDNLYWIAAGSQGTQGLWTLDNYVPKKLTTRKQDNQIATAYGGANASPHSMHLRNLVLNGENHLIITGIVMKAQLIYNSPSIASDSDDPISTTFTHHTSMLAYNVQSQAVWYIVDCSENSMAASGDLFWLPATYQPISGGAVLNKWLNLVVKGSINPLGNVQCEALYAIEGTNTYAIFSDYPNPNTLTLQANNRVLGIIQMPPMDFNTDQRKFVHRASIIQDFLYQISVADYGDTKFYIYWSRDEYGGSSSKSFRRGFLLSATNYRYYIKNLGSARRWTFGLLNQSNQPWRVKFLELDITLGST